MTHDGCAHEKTKSARAACRRARAAAKPHEESFEAQKIYNQLISRELSAQEQNAYDSAVQNANDTSSDEGFELHSPEWIRSFVSTYNYWIDQEEF